jgi:hypothetical protein
MSAQKLCTPVQSLRWVKKGLIYNPSEIGGRRATHAQCPIPLLLGERLRLYFSWRPPVGSDGMYTAFGGFIDVDAANPARILHVHDQPLMGLGGPGDFDCYGCMPGSVVESGGKFFLYYCGWDRRVSTPYNWSIGLAQSDDGGHSFHRIGRGPILGPTLNEPWLQACPMVRIVGGVWHMWYLSGTQWLKTASGMDSVYLLMHATSIDGLNWQRDGVPIMPTRVEHECQTSAAVIELDGQHHMWFSYRHGVDFRNPERGYRIGYAVSADLQQWHRDDSAAGIELSTSGWDSEMLCYPATVEVGGRIYMFYCGNRFGVDGFGYAELERMPA